jgi:HSP20 family molecular chaperone IbpA
VLELPNGYDLSQARASYLNGFLRIDVPPAAPPPHPKSTKLHISDGK